jgi:hypothetical protein
MIVNALLKGGGGGGNNHCKIRQWTLVSACTKISRNKMWG